MSDYELTYNDYDSREKILPERDKAYTPVMEAIGLSIEFGGLPAVDDFNLTVGRTEICGLIGPNGAGKTTVFNLLTKVYQPTRGKILIDGRDTKGMSTIQVNRAGVARTFQNIRLFKNLSVIDNVLIGMHNHTHYNMLTSTLRLPKYWKAEKAAREKALELRDALARDFMVDYDEAGSIGKRYRRQDEIGTPFCITVDFQTVGDDKTEADHCVTVRERDTMEQVRIPIDQVKAYIAERVKF